MADGAEAEAGGGGVAVKVKVKEVMGAEGTLAALLVRERVVGVLVGAKLAATAVVQRQVAAAIT